METLIKVYAYRLHKSHQEDNWLNDFLLHTIAYDQRNQTSYTDAQNWSQWRTVWIIGHEWFDVKQKYKGSGKSNSVQYKIYKPICRLYEIAGAC